MTASSHGEEPGDGQGHRQRERHACRLRRRPALRGHSAAGDRPRGGFLRRLGGFDAVRRGPTRNRRAGKIRRDDGTVRRALRNPRIAQDDLAALCRAGQCRRLAHLRAGRRAQRLGLPSGGGGLSGRARNRPAHRRLWPRLHRRLGRRLRGRHPRRRVSGTFALPRLPHHRHRRHDRSRGRSRPPARPRPGGHASRHRLCRHASRGPLGIPARRGRLQAAPHRQGRRRRTDRRLPRQGRLHRREAHPRRQAGHGGRHVLRRRSGEAHRPPRHALGGARDLLQVPRLLPSHAPGCRRAAPGDRGQ